MLPKSKNPRAGFPERLVVRHVATLVALDFKSPEGPIRPRHVSAAVAPVPETPIDEDGEILLGEEEVWSANNFVGV